MEAPSSRINEAFAKKAAKAASATAEDSASVQAMLGPDQMGRHIAKMVLDVSKYKEAARISRKEPKFLEKLLLRVTEVFHLLALGPRGGRVDHEKVVLYALVALIELSIEGPVRLQSPRKDGRLLDIVVGDAADPCSERAFIALKVVQTGREDLFADGLVSLDHSELTAGIDHLAVVLLRKGAKGGETKAVESMTTPAGKTVLVLYLTAL